MRTCKLSFIDRDFHPPAVGAFAFIENDLVGIILYRGNELQEFILVFRRAFRIAAHKAIYEIPYHLCGKMRRL